jgi:hypothetical protein
MLAAKDRQKKNSFEWPMVLNKDPWVNVGDLVKMLGGNEGLKYS